MSAPPQTRLRLLSMFAFALATSLLLSTTACSGQRGQAAFAVATSMQSAEAPERLIVRNGDIAIAVQDPRAAQAQVEDIISSRKGLIARSTIDESSIWIESRIPSASLNDAMDQIADLGKIVRRSVSAEDVTDQHADLTSRLTTSRQLRTRMRELLDRAQDVKDVLAIESELARVQVDIERMEAQLERLDRNVQLSALSIRLEQKRVFGPLGFVGYWTGWAFSKLFVIQ